MASTEIYDGVPQWGRSWLMRTRYVQADGEEEYAWLVQHFGNEGPSVMRPDNPDLTGDLPEVSYHDGVD